MPGAVFVPLVIAVRLGQATCLALLLGLLLRPAAQRIRWALSLKGLPMGYKNPLIRLDLAADLDADEYEGLWIVMRNPKIQPPAKLTPPDVETDADGRPKRMEDALLATATMQAGLIFDWNLPDPADPAGEAAEPMPIHHRGQLDQGPTPEDVAKVPAAIFTHVTKLITGAINPQ